MMRRLVLNRSASQKWANTCLTDMINISIESFKLLLNEINQIENKNIFIIIREDALLSKGASNEDRGGDRECWMQVLRGCIGTFQMFMRNVGVLSRLAYCMTWGRARNHFYLFFFSCGKSLYSRHFWMCFLSSHAVSVNGARHNNEPAHRDNK